LLFQEVEEEPPGDFSLRFELEAANFEIGEPMVL
jgi:hypothetical protein